MSIPFQATHTADDGRYYMVDGGEWFYANHMGHWKRHWSGAPAGLKELAKKPWSGPEDGLPPVGEEVCIYDEDNYEWVSCKVVYVGVTDGGSAVIGQGNDVIMYGYNNGDIRKSRSIADIVADQRESAIRELMDIAQVDCRVTAARLVDAGFKREVV